MQAKLDEKCHFFIHLNKDIRLRLKFKDILIGSLGRKVEGGGGKICVSSPCPIGSENIWVKVTTKRLSLSKNGAIEWRVEITTGRIYEQR